MRYDSAHKARSRAKILEAARARFRRYGFDGASIDQVMRDADLTRGAFYAHFSSKEALIKEVMAIESGLVHRLRAAQTSDSPATGVVDAMRHYMDPAERSDVATGCPLVAHPVDAIRGTTQLRDGYEARFLALVQTLESSMDSPDDAIVASVLAIGAGIISASVSDADTADRISSICLAKVESLIAGG
ncbi:MAG: TetR/AcrR family transcriptional regulator [Myxococcota bacterium]